jgi:hypothetical protein
MNLPFGLNGDAIDCSRKVNKFFDRLKLKNMRKNYWPSVKDTANGIMICVIHDEIIILDEK